jgi:hypothetical protein
MNAPRLRSEALVSEPDTASKPASPPLRALLDGRHVVRPALQAVAVGELIAITDSGCTALVVYPGQPGTAALRARTTVELRGERIGSRVVLVFEDGSELQPIVIGMLREDTVTNLDAPGQVEVSADGGRVTVLAHERLELRCGDARLTLTRTGQIFIEGSYVLTRSSGVNRITGGSVQIN